MYKKTKTVVKKKRLRKLVPYSLVLQAVKKHSQDSEVNKHFRLTSIMGISAIIFKRQVL